MDEYLGQISAITQANNAWSAQQAANQMAFQERMSSSAHQREVADLQAAGLNPILSAKLGGSSTPSGAMGNTDESGATAFVSLLGNLLQQQIQLEIARVNAQSALAVADRYTATSEIIEQMRETFEAGHPSNLTQLVASIFDGLGLGSFGSPTQSSGVSGAVSSAKSYVQSSAFRNWIASHFHSAEADPQVQYYLRVAQSQAARGSSISSILQYFRDLFSHHTSGKF